MSNANDFDVLAAGTQDLAALVGIFASDSTEPYAFDFSRGWLSPLASILSLLGVLGYIRALVKLGLGREGCRKAKFDTKAERTFFGVLDEDWLPPGDVHHVTYLRRQRYHDRVVWSVDRRIKHTSDSMPILRQALSMPQSIKHGMTVNTCKLSYKLKHFRSGYGHFIVPFVATIFVGLTALTIVPLSPHARPMAWSWYLATIGMFVSLFFSCMMWSWVYAQEMLPHTQSEWADRTSYDPHRQRLSLEKPDTFAFIQSGNQFVTFDLRAVEGKTRWTVRIISFCTAVLGLVSYICQYIEIRAMTSQRSAIWLGVQGLLALIRVLIWVVDPAFDDLQPSSRDRENWHTEPFVSMSEEKLILLRLSKLRASEVQEPPGMPSGSLTIPKWVLGILDLDDAGIAKAFELAHSLHSEKLDVPGWAQVLEIFRNARKVWDLPVGFLGWWIEAHLSPTFNAEPQDHSSSIGCRIIEDGNGRYHYFPYHWESMYGYQIFGDPRVEEKTIHTFVEAHSGDMVSAHCSSLQMGWPELFHHEELKMSGVHRKGSGLSLQRLNTKSTNASSEAIGMWDDLVRILRREGTITFRKRGEFLKDPSTMGISSKAQFKGSAREAFVPQNTSNDIKSPSILPS